MIQLLTGDARDVLPTLPADSVHCVVCSPPYWNLRDYQTGTWSGGDAACGHVMLEPQRGNAAYTNGQGQSYASNLQSWGDRKATVFYRDTCGKCGARRIDRQIGLEATPDEYLATMVQVFREIRRVMRPDATAWINMGDGFRDKQLLLMPARLALVLQADGWWVRSDIIWHKPNPMPESCTDRPTSAHEHVFLLTKSARYFYDADAVRERQDEPTRMAASFRDGGVYTNDRSRNNSADTDKQTHGDGPLASGRNLRNVWTLATHAFPEAHFATYPPELVERCVKAGTSERGCCAACGEPLRRFTERSVAFTSGWAKAGVAPADRAGSKHAGAEQALSGNYDIRMGPNVTSITTGWASSCRCYASTVPCTVLDPFLGSGTTALVADRLQRHAIGIDLSLSYAEMARRRIEMDAGMFADMAPAEPPEDERMRDLFAEAAE